MYVFRGKESNGTYFNLILSIAVCYTIVFGKYLGKYWIKHNTLEIIIILKHVYRLTSSVLTQVHACCGFTLMCSPLQNNRGMCTQGQPFCTCSASHNLSCTCRKSAQCSCELPQVAWSSKVCTVLQSLTNPSWLVEGALVLATVSDPTHVHLDILPS